MGAGPRTTIVASRHEAMTTAGVLAARAWLAARGLSATGVLRWHAEILLDIVDEPAREAFDEHVDTRFRVEIYSEEWGFFFCHGGRASWIRVTDVPFVHGRDDFRLLGVMPPLKDVSRVLRGMEMKHGLEFRRRHARVRTNLAGAEPALRRWVESF